MKQKDNIQVGIGFATGRKGFQKVLRSYIHNWKESGLVGNNEVLLNLLIAYDLHYKNTQITDYTEIPWELANQINEKIFIGDMEIESEIEHLKKENIIDADEATLLFKRGYAGKRNAVLYFAVKNRMDYLLFLDDDEYPVAVTNTRNTVVWGGQHVLLKHLQYLEGADITHGRHCGYISPIPYIEYNERMSESDFRCFIEAISNDILNWENVKEVMQNGGVTYADPQILITNEPSEVEEQNKSKFISGSNLGINLKEPTRLFPFYNPPKARGEDTFLATCLSHRKVLKLPCYTFHDGFSTYHHLLEGVLPIRLKQIKGEEEEIINRFYKACIGWIRYKPLLTYITKPEAYEETIGKIRNHLRKTVPKLCAYFHRPEFAQISEELEKYHENVIDHYREFLATQLAWSKVMEHLQTRS